jgi:hypothetical protein
MSEVFDLFRTMLSDATKDLTATYSNVFEKPKCDAKLSKNGVVGLYMFPTFENANIKGESDGGNIRSICVPIIRVYGSTQRSPYRILGRFVFNTRCDDVINVYCTVSTKKVYNYKCDDILNYSLIDHARVFQFLSEMFFDALRNRYTLDTKLRAYENRAKGYLGSGISFDALRLLEGSLREFELKLHDSNIKFSELTGWVKGSRYSPKR